MLESSLQQSQQQYVSLRQNFDSLQDEYNEQQQIAVDIRTEATTLLEEIKSLSRQNEEYRSNQEKNNTKVKSLESEVTPHLTIDHKVKG